jgi:hypothetical protein
MYLSSLNITVHTFEFIKYQIAFIEFHYISQSTYLNSLNVTVHIYKFINYQFLYIEIN